MLQQQKAAHSLATGATNPSLQAGPLDWIKNHALGLGSGALAVALTGGLGVFVWRRNRSLFHIPA